MGEDSDDVILVFEEKKFIENINYAVWPGDINHEERERAKKRKRDNEDNSNNNNDEADTNDKDEDPIHSLNKRACLSNRYFSSENTIKLVSGDKSTTTSTRQTFTRNNAASGENDDFVRRRDYLMKKLLQSRTLPNLDEDQQILPSSKSSVEIPVEVTSKKSSGDDVEEKPTPLMTIKSMPTTSSSSFNVNDEFIPLRSAETPTTSTSENRQTPSTPLENVNGCNLRPYPRDSINRVKDHLKYLFSENSPFALYESNQAQRTFEIVKLKLGLNSKFANDPSVLRRIEREKAEAKRLLQDRFKLIEAKLRRSNPNTTCIDLCTTEEEDDDDDDDDDEAEETDEDERDEIMKYIAKEDTINLDDDDDSEDERTSSSEKSDDDEEDEESEKEDSKYYQYGKYSTKKNKGEEVPVIKKGKKVSSISSRVNLSKVKSKGKKLGNTKGQDLDQLEVDYNALRRRKLNNLKRKKKRTLSKSEFELEKKLINTELRKMRKSMRKMKNKKQKTNQATNSSSSIVSLNSNSNNSTDKYKKRTNKPKRNKSFFIDNSGFNPFRHGANIKKPKGRFFPRFNKYEVLQRNSKKNHNH